MKQELATVPKPLQIEHKYFEHEIIYPDQDTIRVAMGEVHQVQFLDSGTFYAGTYIPIVQAIFSDEKARVMNSCYADIPWVFGEGTAQVGEVSLRDSDFQPQLTHRYPHYKITKKLRSVRLQSSIHSPEFPAYVEVDPITGSYTEVLGSRVTTVNIMPLAGLNHRLELNLTGIAISGNIEESVISCQSPSPINLHLDRVTNDRSGMLLGADESIDISGRAGGSFRAEKFKYDDSSVQIKSAGFDDLPTLKSWEYNPLFDEWSVIPRAANKHIPGLVGKIRLERNQMQITKTIGPDQLLTVRSQIYP